MFARKSGARRASIASHLIHQMLEVRGIGIDVMVQGVVCEGFPRRTIGLNFDRMMDRTVVLNRTRRHERHSSHVDDVLELASVLRDRDNGAEREREKSDSEFYCQNLVV